MKKTIAYINLILICSLLASMLFGLYVFARFKYLAETQRSEESQLLISLSTTYDELKIFFLELNNYEKADINIKVKESKWIDLHSDLPWSGQDYKKCKLTIHGDKYKGKIKLHGDGYWHYLFHNKSYAIKLKKSKEKYNRNTKYHLVIPKSGELMNNHLSYKLAKKLGLLAPESELVTIGVNGKNMGIRLMVESANEAFLRKNNLFPGDIYSGENHSYKDIYYGTWKLLHEGAYLWDKKSKFNAYEEENLVPLEQALESIKKGKYELFDIEAFARLSLFLDLINSLHLDSQHNWKLYYDPFRNKMIPIVWDPVGYMDGFIERKKSDFIITSRIMKEMYRNYQFHLLKQEAFNDFYASGRQELIELLRQEIDKIKDKANRGYLNKGVHYTYDFDTELQDKLNDFVRKVEDVHTKYFEACLQDENNISYSREGKVLHLQVHSGVPVARLIFEGDNLKKNMNSVVVRYLLDGEENSHTVTLKMEPGTAVMNTVLFPNIRITRKYDPQSHFVGEVNKTAAAYDIIFENADLVKNITGIKAEWLDPKHSVSQGIEGKHIGMQSFRNVSNVWVNTTTPTEEIWEGKITISKDTIINNPILIKPGTKVTLGDSVLLQFNYKVEALGVEGDSIYFESFDTSSSFGAILLNGTGCNTSKFQYCRFSNGSGFKSDLQFVSGMFSIHNVQDFLIDHCRFEGNQVYDDQVHVVYSKGIFRDASFFNGYSDLLDVDISDVQIERCLFESSGNDGLDFMSSKAKVVQSYFAKCVDKGISIGEGSKIDIKASEFYWCDTGVLSKDDSEVELSYCKFERNQKALDSYRKSDYYNFPGSINASNITFKENESDFDKKSDYITVK